MNKELEAVEKLKNYFLNKQPLSLMHGEKLVKIIESALIDYEKLKYVIENKLYLKKTLYITFYDYPFSYDAYVLIDKKFKNVDLIIKEKEFESLNYLGYKFKERRIEILSTIESILNSYDEIIICNNGVFDYYDTKELSYELRTLRK